MGVAAAGERAGVLEYADSRDPDIRPLVVRVWWSTLIWASAYATWAGATFVEVAMARPPYGPLDWANLYTYPAVASGLTAGALAIALIVDQWRGRGLGTLTRAAALMAMAGAAAFMFPYAHDIATRQTARGSSYVLLVSAEALAMHLGVALLPLCALLVTSEYARRPHRRLASAIGPPAVLAVGLALLAAAALASRHAASLGYVFDSAEPLLSALKRTSWAVVAVRSLMHGGAAGLLAWSLWRLRSGGSPWIIVRIAVCIVILTEVGGAAVILWIRGYHYVAAEPLGLPLAVLRQHVFSVILLAPLLPALTWPRRRGAVS